MRTSPDRNWESDAQLSDAARADGFPDIARQLVEFRAGDGIDVAFGGGRDVLPARRDARTRSTPSCAEGAATGAT